MGFDTIKQCLDFNKEQEEIGKLEKDNPSVECPFDAWPLNIDSQGNKSCPICGRVWK